MDVTYEPKNRVREIHFWEVGGNREFVIIKKERKEGNGMKKRVL